MKNESYLSYLRIFISMEMLFHEKTRFKIWLLFLCLFLFLLSCFDTVSMQYRYSIDTVSILYRYCIYTVYISMGPYGVPGSLSMGPYGVPGSRDSWTRGLGTRGLGTRDLGGT